MLFIPITRLFAPTTARGFFYAAAQDFNADVPLSELLKPSTLVFTILAELQLHTFDKVA